MIITRSIPAWNPAAFSLAVLLYICSSMTCFSNGSMTMFFHLASGGTISLTPVWNPLPNWSRHQSLSRHYGKPCSPHESVVTGECTTLFAYLWYMYNIWRKHATRTAWSTWLVYIVQPLLNRTQNYVTMFVENVAVLVHLLTWLCLASW